MMAWRRSGDKPLSEPMMVNLLTHICVTRPQWIKDYKMWLFYTKVVLLSTRNGDSSCYPREWISIACFKMSGHYTKCKYIILFYLFPKKFSTLSISHGDPEIFPANYGHTTTTQIARFMRLTWGPPGSCRPHDGPTNLAIRAVCHGRLSPDMISHIDVSRKRP